MSTKNAAGKITDDLRPDYDLSKLTGGVRGKYDKRATAGTTLVLLDPDVAEAFPDGRTVNDVLRAVVKIARAQAAPVRGRTPIKPTGGRAKGRRSSTPKKPSGRG